MVNAKELMIGNLVSVIDGGESRILVIETIDFHKAYVARGRKIHYMYKEMDPIPLTPEWLDRLGLVEKDLGIMKLPGTLSVIGRGDITIQIVKEAQCLFYLPFGLDTEIRYVHQLQNFYFACTGKELKIKRNRK
jgi:hypothetical protein